MARSSLGELKKDYHFEFSPQIIEHNKDYSVLLPLKKDDTLSVLKINVITHVIQTYIV
jgi:hypothetical protein